LAGNHIVIKWLLAKKMPKIGKKGKQHMKKETYQKIFDAVNARPYGIRAIQAIGEVLTFAAAILYFVVIGSLAYAGKWLGMAALILVPAASFVAVSIFRSRYNAKRPYEVYGFKPLIPKGTRGKSFPSRHVFSIFVIGSSVCCFYPLPGCLVCLMGCVLAVIRVAAGVHFPKDVIAGAVIGILCGCFIGIMV